MSTISPYPASVRIKAIADGSQVFDDGKFVGEVHQSADGWIARPFPENLALNRRFGRKVPAVEYLLTRPTS